MHDVFISYARAERALAEPLKQRLVSLGLSVFFDIEGIDGGTVFPDVITRALDSSRAVLACYSPLYFTRPWCLTEAQEGAHRNVLVPVAVRPFERAEQPANLRWVNWIDLSDWNGSDNHEDWGRTLRALSKLVGRDLELQKPSKSEPLQSVMPPPPKRSSLTANLVEVTSADDLYDSGGPSPPSHSPASPENQFRPSEIDAGQTPSIQPRGSFARSLDRRALLGGGAALALLAGGILLRPRSNNAQESNELELGTKQGSADVDNLPQAPAARPIIKTWQTIATLQGGTLRTAELSPDGACVATANGDAASVWDAVDGRELVKLTWPGKFAYAAKWSPDGTRVFTSSVTVGRVWDAASGKALATLEATRAGSVGWSPDGTRILTGGIQAFGTVSNAETGEVVFSLAEDDNDMSGMNPRSFSFSPDGKRFVAACSFNIARVWDALTGSKLFDLDGHKAFVNSAAWSPDGICIVTAGDDNNARIWDASTGKEIGVLSGHGNWVVSAVWSLDGKRIVTASEDGTARIWEASTQTEMVTLSGHEKRVASASWSPDGAKILTASEDASARIWDAATGRQTDVLLGHTNSVTSASWSTESARILTTSLDKTARIWELRDSPV